MCAAPTYDRRITITGAQDLLSIPEQRSSTPERRYALLIFCDGEAQMKLLEEGQSVVLGREAPSEIVVNDPSVSRQHARFYLSQGTVWVEDLDSRNGTFLRGQRVERQALEQSQEVLAGRVKVTLAVTEPTRPAEDPASAAEAVVVQSPRMKQLYEDAARAARGNLPVLILGETGSGKEHVAREVHRQGARKERDLVVINCAAIAPSLLESTLFGHERGAFTGAVNRAVGMFERADGGVLFLDEIGELSSGAQAALLRAIETRRICRVGSTKEIPVDVQIVAATHCDLESMLEEGTFRQDLYYRLSGIQLYVPPLRERREEIEPLARLFLERARRDWRLPPRTLSREALAHLCDYAWPGNVRQLRHAVERAALLAGKSELAVEDFPEFVLARKPAPAHVPLDAVDLPELALKSLVRRYERAVIEEALRRSGGNRQLAAKLLRVPLRTLFRKLREGRSSDENP